MKSKNIVSVILVLLCLLVWSMRPLCISYGLNNESTSERIIDLFTQKKPYSGHGLNQPSDAFAPQEEVILYANVTYRGAPIANKLVAFQVNGPPNPLQNITIYDQGETNATGIAQASFRIPWPETNPRTIVFGTWKAVANVDIAEEIVQDTLTFQVGWIVEIISAITVDEDLQPQTRFMQESFVRVILTMKNIAKTPKNVMLVVVVFDSLRYIIDSAIIDDLKVEPGEMLVYCSAYISEWAACGNATLHACAYTSLGPAYCPEVSRAFRITLFGDLNGDGVVDISDMGEAARAFGSYPGHPRWNPYADINHDGIVDISDISLIARNFGRTCK